MTRTRTSPIRAVLRFVASVMIVSGVLLIADAGLTVAWEEPISSFLTHRQQDRLRDELAHPPARVLRPTAHRRPLPGDAIGRIVLPTIHRAYYVVEGTSLDDLRKGPGHYSDTPLPGERGTVGIAGHRTTHGAPFRHIDHLGRGDRIVLQMPYGTFTYRVQKRKIVAPTDLSVKRKVRYDRLFLSACHPLYSAAQRIVVFARLAGRSRGSAVRRGRR